jgi:hypothetical protein
VGLLRSGEARRALDDNIFMRTLGARAAVLAFGDELLDLGVPPRIGKNGAPMLPKRDWDSLGGREMAAGCLLPRAEAALCQELQRLADAVKLAREGQCSSSSVSRAR